jgi:hypothetical protein
MRRIFPRVRALYSGDRSFSSFPSRRATVLGLRESEDYGEDAKSRSVLMLAVSGWMNQRQTLVIKYLREENGVYGSNSLKRAGAPKCCPMIFPA